VLPSAGKTSFALRDLPHPVQKLQVTDWIASLPPKNFRIFFAQPANGPAVGKSACRKKEAEIALCLYGMARTPFLSLTKP
jgi:hypothetical protein